MHPKKITILISKLDLLKIFLKRFRFSAKIVKNLPDAADWSTQPFRTLQSSVQSNPDFLKFIQRFIMKHKHTVHCDKNITVRLICDEQFFSIQT